MIAVQSTTGRSRPASVRPARRRMRQPLSVVATIVAPLAAIWAMRCRRTAAAVSGSAMNCSAPGAAASRSVLQLDQGESAGRSQGGARAMQLLRVLNLRRARRFAASAVDAGREISKHRRRRCTRAGDERSHGGDATARRAPLGDARRIGRAGWKTHSARVCERCDRIGVRYSPGAAHGANVADRRLSRGHSAPPYISMSWESVLGRGGRC